MNRAALYLRASSDHQRYSTSNQDEALRRFASEHGFFVVAVYEDDGCSGLDLEGRPALRRLLHDVLEPTRAFEVLLVLDVSRWGRFQDVDESAHYEYLCRRAGVRLIYCAEPFLAVDTPLASVLKSIRRAMAAEYSRDLSRRVIVGQRRLAREGFSQGGVPKIGLRRMMVGPDRDAKGPLEPGQQKALATDRVILIPGPEQEVALIRRIFRMCAEEGLGTVDIAHRLNAEGLPSPGGSIWRPCAVRGVLRNAKYVGDNVYGRTSGPLKQPRRPTAPDTWVRRPDAFAGVVPRSLFDRAQQVLDDRRRFTSDEEMIAGLRALLARNGKLSGPMIDAEPNLPAARAYQWRFHGLVNAYRLAGFEPSRSYALPQRRKHSREHLLEILKTALARHGQLSRSIMERDAAVPSIRIYQWEFGSLAQAYAEIGYVQQRLGRPTPKRYRPLLGVPS